MFLHIAQELRSTEVKMILRLYSSVFNKVEYKFSPTMCSTKFKKPITYIGPYYKWDNKKKDFKKPILIVTQELAPKKENK